MPTDGRRVFWAMVSTYRMLLERIKRLDGDVFTHRVRLSRWQKLRIAARSVLRPGAPPVARIRKSGAR